MKQDIPMYLLTCAILGMAVYLRSPMICVSIIALWGINAAQNIMTRKNRDEDISAMMAPMAGSKGKMGPLSPHNNNGFGRSASFPGGKFQRKKTAPPAP